MFPTDLVLVFAFGLIGISCWVGAYLYFKKNPEKFKGINVAVAVLALGPLLPLMHSSMAKRCGEITNRELWGLLAVVALMIAAIAVTPIFGVGIRGR